MDQKAPDELIAVQGHGFVSMFVAAIVLPSKGNGVTIKAQQPVITDRHPMGVAGQVSQYRLGSGKGTLGIHDPVGLLLCHDPLCKVHRMLQCLLLAEELKLVVLIGLVQPLQEQPSEQP